MNPSEGKRFLQGLPSTTGDGSDWTPLPAREFAAELARTHLDYEIDVSQKPKRGGMGAVYRARLKPTGQPVAIKALRHDRVDHEAFLRRFKTESETLKKLDHPNVVKISDASETDQGTPFFVMEWLEGQTLAEVLAGPARLTRQRKLDLMAAICAGVEYVHQRGIFHRDLKSQNILIVAADGRPVILDFGVARDASRGPSTLSREHGTPYTTGYIAPELLENPSAVCVRTDVYSLGIVFLEMIIGRFPWTGHPKPSAFEFTAAMDKVVEQATEHEPSQRYATVAQFAAAITKAAEAVVQVVRPVEPPIISAEDLAQKVNDMIDGKKILHTPFGRFSIHGDGTFTDETTGLMWMQAPYGMKWTGRTFEGAPEFFSWNEASSRFGRGVILEPVPGEVWTAEILKKYLEASRFEQGYAFGNQQTSFAGWSNWRLPTMQDCASLQHSHLWPHKRFQDRSPMTAEIFRMLFPLETEPSRGSFFWTANAEDWALPKLLKFFARRSGSYRAFKADFSRFSDDDSSAPGCTYQVLLVRTAEKPQSEVL